jgi:hypothetical protein
MEKQNLLKRYVPVIMGSFALAFIIPDHQFTPENINQYISGVATGFGLAWTGFLMRRWRKLTNENKGERSEA